MSLNLCSLYFYFIEAYIYLNVPSFLRIVCILKYFYCFFCLMFCCCIASLIIACNCPFHGCEFYTHILFVFDCELYSMPYFLCHHFAIVCLEAFQNVSSNYQTIVCFMANQFVLLFFSKCTL